MQHTTARRWIFICTTLFLVLLTITPYIFGYIATPAGHTYSGIDYLASGDTNTYFSMIEEVKQGHWSFHNLFTSEEHPAAYVNLLWLGVGLLARLFSLTPFLAFQLARMLLIPVLVYAVMRILYYVFGQQHKKVLLGLATIFFASGMGLFIDGFLHNSPISIQHPVDLWVTEAIPFLSVMHSPHFIVSIALLVLSLFWVMRAFLEHRHFFAILAGLSSAVLFSTHPFYVPTIYVVSVVWAAALLLTNYKKYQRVIVSWIIFFGISAPVLTYFLWLNNLHVVFHEWSSANVLSSPNPWMYIIGFGWLIPFAVIGMARKRHDIRFQLLSCWVLVNIVLLYSPISFQRRLIEGFQIPLGIFATIGVLWLLRRANTRSWYAAMAIGLFLIVFLPLGNLQMIFQDMFLYSNPNSIFYYMYYPLQSDLDGMSWLKDNTTDADIILSSKEIGNFIPAQTGRRVFIGHKPQTLFSDVKAQLVIDFYQSPSSSKQFLRDWDITYVFYSAQDKTLDNFDPPVAPFLIQVHATDTAIIYQVVD
ncbi:MAG: hypothetical protein COT25_04800 [Candidatus Kerfeldbacteria bacterium CG08_land_8_20_14_0_20_42_7]|uniref:Glycosyltransferase RgtA/B/C/D-like domain-containing protein n=1 Tax=Candidatus Kerfeldbacteria bacterium CG08_land_8_20_14_0_20_42_7 TaxID=2014245 RepID=A0A2H0YRP2_9BACT|nr:MAG: hypothetical protein COT25_04800 [Candidatus Kerfeldbacteria bacterium CG08_land_8_20_14_0_20_42_7]